MHLPGLMNEHVLDGGLFDVHHRGHSDLAGLAIESNSSDFKFIGADLLHLRFTRWLRGRWSLCGCADARLCKEEKNEERNGSSDGKHVHPRIRSSWFPAIEE